MLNIGKHLLDAIENCARANELVIDIDQQDFIADRTRVAATILYLMWTGEALVRLRRDAPEIYAKLPEGPKIIDQRNFLIHVYDAINEITIYRTALTAVPETHDRLVSLLAEWEAKNDA